MELVKTRFRGYEDVLEGGLWRCRTRLDKFEEDELPSDLRDRARIRPYETLEHEGNVLVNGAASATQGGVAGMWDRLIGNTTVVAYNNANARVGVGDSSTAATNADTDLNAATNKLRKAMNASYPQLTAAASRGVIFQSDFTTGEANFAWNEWGVFNTATAAQGMLNHAVASLGTKASGTWTLTVTLSIT